VSSRLNIQSKIISIYIYIYVYKYTHNIHSFINIYMNKYIFTHLNIVSSTNPYIQIYICIIYWKFLPEVRAVCDFGAHVLIEDDRIVADGFHEHHMVICCSVPARSQNTRLHEYICCVYMWCVCTYGVPRQMSIYMDT